MESTDFTPYIIQHYEPEKMPELVLNGSEMPQFIHCHENLDQLPQGLPKTVSVYAKVKKEIEYLEELLKNYSIKEKSTLYSDLTKILSYEHSSLAFLSSFIDAVINLKIRHLQIDPYWQNPEKWQSTPGTPAIVNIYQDPTDPRQILCKHSHHENLLNFKSYKELCCWISLLKADIAYFNNIENAEVWVNEFSRLSEESMKSFKFLVDVHKITDEIFLNMLEKIEPKLREQYTNKMMRNLRNDTGAFLQRTPQFVASPIPISAGNAVPIESPSQPNPQSNHRQQELNLPTIPTPLPTPQGQPTLPTTPTQLPAAPSQAIDQTNSSSNNSSQVSNKESHKRKKSSTASSKKPSTRRSKKSKTKTTAESPLENVPREEAIMNNQTTTTQKETPSAERVEAPLNREENLEKEKELVWFDSIINGFGQEISDFPDIEDPFLNRPLSKLD